MNKKLVFILCFISLVAGYYLIIQEHILEDPVFHYSSIAGNLGPPLTYENAMKYPNDYYMLLTYESTGAFMAGREISVSADFTAVHKIQTLRNLHIWVVFPGALNVPIDQERLDDASIELKFINESSNRATGKGKIIYYMPDYYKESIISLNEGINSQIFPAISNDSRYTYILIIEGIPQKPENVLMMKNRFLSIAPLETYLQLKINNWIIFLTIIAAVLTLIQIIRKDEK